MFNRPFKISGSDRPGFAHRQPRAVADVQDVNFIFTHGKKDPVFVLAATVKNFSDFRI